MQDHELKKLLLETCPVRPGQEDRAWSALKDRLYPAGHFRLWQWLYYPSWRGAVVAVVALVLIPLVGNSMWKGLKPTSLATADSQSPGIYATSFYSRPAQAQVVWLNGLDPASDKPTYLDPTTDASGRNKASEQPAGDPNSL